MSNYLELSLCQHKKIAYNHPNNRISSVHHISYHIKIEKKTVKDFWTKLPKIFCKFRRKKLTGWAIALSGWALVEEKITTMHIFYQQYLAKEGEVMGHFNQILRIILKSGPESDSMEYLAPHATFLNKLVMANLWILSSVVSAILAGRSIYLFIYIYNNSFKYLSSI